MHHLPRRRPRDHLGAAVVCDLLPRGGPRIPGEGPRRGRRDPGDDGAADVRSGAAAALPPAGPPGDPAAATHRPGLQPPPVPGRGHRRPVGPARRHLDHGGHPCAAPGSVGVGSGRGGVHPRPPRPGAEGGSPAVPVPALRHRAAGVHRPAVRVAGGDAGAGDAVAALPVRRPPRLPAARPAGADAEAGGLPHPSAVPPRGAARPVRTAGGGHDRPGRPARGAGTDVGGAARDAVVGAVRLQPRYRRGDCQPVGAGGTDRGFDVTVGPLDEHVDDLPADGALLVVCASYNGTPPDNAVNFTRWIANAAAEAAAEVSYSVFGCGSTEWASTYQAVPTLLDEQLAAHGGRRVVPRGEGDGAGDFDAAYRGWHAELWAEIVTALGLPAEVAASAPAGPRLSITLTNRQVTNPVIVSYAARPAQVRVNR